MISMGGCLYRKLSAGGGAPPVKGPLDQGGGDPKFFRNQKTPKGSDQKRYPGKEDRHSHRNLGRPALLKTFNRPPSNAELPRHNMFSPGP